VGTRNVHELPLVPGKVPNASVEQLERTLAPSKVNEIVELARKPSPEAATELPIGPETGAMVIELSIAKTASARFRPSVAANISAPLGAAVVAKEQGVPVWPGKLPEPSV
jgi:hypothetical protein